LIGVSFKTTLENRKRERTCYEAHAKQSDSSEQSQLSDERVSALAVISTISTTTSSSPSTAAVERSQPEGRDCVKRRDRVEDKAQLLMRQRGVQHDEDQRRGDERCRPRTLVPQPYAEQQDGCR